MNSAIDIYIPQWLKHKCKNCMKKSDIKEMYYFNVIIKVQNLSGTIGNAIFSCVQKATG